MSLECVYSPIWSWLVSKPFAGILPRLQGFQASRKFGRLGDLGSGSKSLKVCYLLIIMGPNWPQHSTLPIIRFPILIVSICLCAKSRQFLLNMCVLSLVFLVFAVFVVVWGGIKSGCRKGVPYPSPFCASDPGGIRPIRSLGVPSPPGRNWAVFFIRPMMPTDDGLINLSLVNNRLIKWLGLHLSVNKWQGVKRRSKPIVPDNALRRYFSTTES